MLLAQLLVWALACYAGLGLLFAVPFVMFGLPRVDAAARGAGVGFRLLLLPGVAAFWPLLAGRWWRGVTEAPQERNAHRDLAEGKGRR